METKVYNRRQARWAEKLAAFDFIIIYRSGSLREKPDTLSRRSDYRPLKGGDATGKPNEFKFLKPHQLINFPEHAERLAIIAHLSLSTVIVQSFDLDVEFANKIKAALPMDPNIGPYIANL